MATGAVEPTFHLVNLGDLSSLRDLMASESKPLYGAGLHSLPLLLNHSRGARACLSEACGRP